VSDRYDVVVLGGGPAGAATATALARLHRTVALFEPSSFDRPRAGETLGAEVQTLLTALGLDGTSAPAPVPFRAVRSAWGSPDLVERSLITHPLGDGWHVDRARFDDDVARKAAEAGVSVRLHCGRCEVARTPDGFAISPAAGEAASGQWLVDASGRGAPVSTALGEGRWMQFDRLVGLLGRMALPAGRTADPELLLEADEHGWWYSVPQPGGTLLVALMTDADLPVARGRAGLNERWSAALARTIHTRERAGGATLAGPIHTVRADSGLLLPDRGRGWRAVGDAAMAQDPLAGNGVARALRSAMAAAEIDRTLDPVEAVLQVGRSDPDQVGRSDRFSNYLDQRAHYYATERRWPSSLFWMRRQPPDWTQAALTLDPETMLGWNGEPLSAEAFAVVESLLPRRAITELLESLRTARPAHDALQSLRSHAPLGDRRLLVALQLLVERALLVG
jgi:flavin-dependent dehydrogenase